MNRLIDIAPFVGEEPIVTPSSPSNRRGPSATGGRGVESSLRRREHGGDLAKQEWGGLSEAQVAKRLGRMLGVTFAGNEIVGLGGVAGGLAEVGDLAWVALQVEEKHTHPAENVLQYWPWLERSRRRLVLVHAIAPDARKRTGHRTDLTKWLGAMMERVLPGRFTYCRLDLGTAEETAQLAAATAAVDQLRRPPQERTLVPVL